MIGTSTYKPRLQTAAEAAGTSEGDMKIENGSHTPAGDKASEGREGKRGDYEHRPTFMKVGAVSGATGSAYVEMVHPAHFSICLYYNRE